MEPHPALAELAGRLQLAQTRSRWSGAIDGVGAEMAALEGEASGAVVKLSLGKGSPHGWRADPAEARPDLPHPGLVTVETSHQTGILSLRSVDRMGAEVAEAWVRAFVKHALNSGWMKEDGACCVCGKEGRMVSAVDPVLLCGECLPQVRMKKAEWENKGPGTWSAVRAGTLLACAVAAVWAGLFTAWDVMMFRMFDGHIKAPLKLLVLGVLVLGGVIGVGAGFFPKRSSFGCKGVNRWAWVAFLAAGILAGEELHHQLTVAAMADAVNPVGVLTAFFRIMGSYEFEWALIAGLAAGIFTGFILSLPGAPLLYSAVAKRWLDERRAEEEKAKIEAERAKAAACGYVLTGVQVMK